MFFFFEFFDVGFVLFPEVSLADAAADPFSFLCEALGVLPLGLLFD